MREDAYALVPDAEKVALGEIATRSMTATFDSTPAVGPGQKWTRESALKVVGAKLTGRDFVSGRNLFHATSCAKCHRYNGEGGAIGPDLSTAGRKFAMPDMIDAIVEPSKVISDQYGSHQIMTVDGQVFTGRMVEIGNQIRVYTSDMDKPPIELTKDDVEEMKVSPISQMPLGLVDSLNPEELKDLVAYLISGGNPNAPEFH